MMSIMNLSDQSLCDLVVTILLSCQNNKLTTNTKHMGMVTILSLAFCLIHMICFVCFFSFGNICRFSVLVSREQSWRAWPDFALPKEQLATSNPLQHNCISPNRLILSSVRGSELLSQKHVNVSGFSDIPGNNWHKICWKISILMTSSCESKHKIRVLQTQPMFWPIAIEQRLGPSDSKRIACHIEVDFNEKNHSIIVLCYLIV